MDEAVAFMVAAEGADRIHDFVPTLITTVRGTTVESTTLGKVVFGYKDKANFTDKDNCWYVDFSSNSNIVTLRQMIDGVSYERAAYEPDDYSELNLTNDAVIHIETTSEGMLSVYVYQGENKYVVAENFDAKAYNDGKAITGKMGVGTNNALHIQFNDFAVIVN